MVGTKGRKDRAWGRIAVTGLFGMSLVLMLGTQASAYTYRGTSIKASGHPVDCIALLVGIKNTSTFGVVNSCAIQITEITTKCVNPANNAETAGGRPFRPGSPIGVGGEQVGQDFTFERNGKATSEIDISAADIQAALAPFLPSPRDAGCPNDNWHVFFHQVTRLNALFTLETCETSSGSPKCLPESPGCTCDIVQDQVCLTSCTLPPGEDPEFYEGCTEVPLTQCPIQ